jgi:hypothetical protein
VAERPGRRHEQRDEERAEVSLGVSVFRRLEEPLGAQQQGCESDTCRSRSRASTLNEANGSSHLDHVLENLPDPEFTREPRELRSIDVCLPPGPCTTEYLQGPWFAELVLHHVRRQVEELERRLEDPRGGAEHVDFDGPIPERIFARLEQRRRKCIPVQLAKERAAIHVWTTQGMFESLFEILLDGAPRKRLVPEPFQDALRTGNITAPNENVVVGDRSVCEPFPDALAEGNPFQNDARRPSALQRLHDAPHLGQNTEIVRGYLAVRSFGRHVGASARPHAVARAARR